MPAVVTVRYWAGAARAAGTDTELISASSVGELRRMLGERSALANVSQVASFLVDGLQAGDATALRDGAEVDVLPPFAGGAGDEPAVRLTALVSGRVQGVGFRDWTARTARLLGLDGSAENLPDGRVEVLAEGERAACEAFLEALRGGETPGEVDDVAESWDEPRGELTSFRAV